MANEDYDIIAQGDEVRRRLREEAWDQGYWAAVNNRTQTNPYSTNPYRKKEL